MGAWTYVQPRINTAIRHMCDSAGSPTHREVYAHPPPSAVWLLLLCSVHRLPVRRASAHRRTDRSSRYGRHLARASLCQADKSAGATVSKTKALKKRYGGKRESSRQFWKPFAVRAALLSALFRPGTTVHAGGCTERDTYLGA